MNKRNLQKLVLALIIPVIYLLSIAGVKSITEDRFIRASEAAVTDVKDFMNAMSKIYSEGTTEGTTEGNLLKRNLPLYKDTLHYNGIQMYDNRSQRFGEFAVPLSGTQITNVRQLMSDTESKDLSKDLRGFYARTKISKLAEGQRLVYEVSQSGSTTVNDGFCYQNVMNNTFTTDTGRTVLHAKTSPADHPDPPGWLCNGIFENMQHSDLINGRDRSYWFLKPMMRIDQSDFNDTSITPVVAVVIQNFQGITIDSVVIRVRNFRKSNGEYSGNYTDEYNFISEVPPVDLIISGNDSISSGLNYGNNGNIDQSKIDFKVYWFGQVDVWFDKMTVDDEIGDGLFKTEYDHRISDESTKENFAMLICSLRNNESLRYSNYSSINYVLSKMYDHIYPVSLAEAR